MRYKGRDGKVRRTAYQKRFKCIALWTRQSAMHKSIVNPAPHTAATIGGLLACLSLSIFWFALYFAGSAPLAFVAIVGVFVGWGLMFTATPNVATHWPLTLMYITATSTFALHLTGIPVSIRLFGTGGAAASTVATGVLMVASRPRSRSSARQVTWSTRDPLLLLAAGNGIVLIGMSILAAGAVLSGAALIVVGWCVMESSRNLKVTDEALQTLDSGRRLRGVVFRFLSGICAMGLFLPIPFGRNVDSIAGSILIISAIVIAVAGVFHDGDDG
jgi:hypothetical protein